MVAYALLLSFFTCLVLFTLWRSWLDAPPTLRAATPSLPNPNAHDFWLEAAGRLTSDDRRRITAAVPDGLYPSSTSDPSVKLTLAEKEALLRAQHAVLGLTREGLRHGYHAPFTTGQDPDFDYLRQFRELSRLLRLEAEVHAARRNWKGAVSSSLEALEMGVRVPRGNALIGLLYGAQDQAAARALLWKYLPNLTPEQARAAGYRIERLCEEQIPFWQALEWDKQAGQSWLLVKLQNRKWRGTLQEHAIRSVTHWPQTGGQWLLVYQIQTRGKAQVLNDYTTAMDQAIELAKRIRWGSNTFPAPADPLTEQLIPSPNPGWFAALKTEAQNHLVRLGHALHAYRTEHGRYPDKLEELVPRYLTRVPADPFAPGKPCRYRRRGADFVLYSVGPDCQDNGGLPATSRMRARKPGGVPYALTRNSLGDLVAGKNLW